MTHPSELQLENYLLGGLNAPVVEDDRDAEIAIIEEHLLICETCLDWVQVQENTIRTMRECLRLPLPKRERKVKPRVMSASYGGLF